MTPRWNAIWYDEDRCTFLGGTNVVDLCIDYEGDLRMVCGEHSISWDYFRVNPTTMEIERMSYDCEPVTDEVVKEALTYLSLFAPNWIERSPTYTVPWERKETDES